MGDFDRLAGLPRRKDLQVRGDERLVAVERDIGQAGEMRDAAGDGFLVRRGLHDRRDGLVAGGAGQMGAAIEHAVFGIDRLGIIVGAGIGARRVAGNQIVDFQPVLDGAQAPLQRTASPHRALACPLPQFFRHR